MKKTNDIACNCITYPCNCGKIGKPQPIGGSETEKKVFETQRLKKAKRRVVRNRQIVFLALVGGLIYLATRK